MFYVSVLRNGLLVEDAFKSKKAALSAYNLILNSHGVKGELKMTLNTVKLGWSKADQTVYVSLLRG